MNIAVASGKGGTGKTTVATNLAVTAAAGGRSVAYLDCDVEEPNGAIFLKPEFDRQRPVEVSVPAVDLDKCIGCGQCGEICRYNAIVAMDRNVLVFPELCHGCGGCGLVCPSGAITESHRATGRLDIGRAGKIACVQGTLNIGEVMSPPVISAVKQARPEADLCIVDAPPGTSCPVIESVRDADFVILVTEPTPFGLNDLRLAVDMVRALELRFGVVINRAGLGDGETQTYCRQQRISLLAEIPDDRKVAEAYSRGRLALSLPNGHRRLFAGLLADVEAAAQRSAAP